MVNSPQNPEGMDKSDPAKAAGEVSGGTQGEASGDNATEAGASFDFLRVIEVAEARDNMFKGAVWKNRVRRGYDAWHSRHSDGSRYSRPDYAKRRSTLFRPRTRSSVRKNMAAIAASFFTSPDSVSVQTEVKGDPVKTAAAAVLQQLLNYRLDRTSAKSGIPFFLVVSGAAQDAQITGICYSKQFWEYEKVTEKRTEIVVRQHYHEGTENPVKDPQTGEPMLSQEEKHIDDEFVTKDRPQCINYPPENVILDPAAYWINPEQRSSYLILRHGMTMDDAKQLLANPGKSGEQWLDVSDAQLQRVAEDYTSKGVRIARAADRTDPHDNRGDSGGGAEGKEPHGAIVWLYENFIRAGGVDYHFWSLGSRAYASKVRTTRQAYPEQRGERPVTRGYAQIEAHESFPESPVTTWLPMQRELNDIVNLRLDTMKQALAPIAKVKQGTTFDFAQLQQRGGEGTTILVRDVKDLEFDRAPDTTAGAYQETTMLNSDFDDLAAVFAPSSVDTNRRLNETVGGMQLLSSSANAVGEFDTRTFTETWGEPTLRQIVRLEQYYESDEMVLEIAAGRANMDKLGVQQISDSDLEHEVAVRVNAGLGSADPQQRLAKLANSVKILAPMIPMMNKPVHIKAEETIDEIMGLAGYHDGRRFFDFGDGPPPPPPAVAKMMQVDKTNTSRERVAANRDNVVLQRERMHEMFALVSEIIKQQGATAMAGADQSAASAMGQPISLTGAFKDLPPDAKAQALAQHGIYIHPDTIAAHDAILRQPEGTPMGAGGPVRGPTISNATSLFHALSGLLQPPQMVPVPQDPGAGGGPPGMPGMPPPGGGQPPPMGGMPGR